jgi:hypothetical protein
MAMAAAMEFVTPTRKRIRRFKLDKGFTDIRGRRHYFGGHASWGSIALRNFPDSWRTTDCPLYLVNPECITPADNIEMAARKVGSGKMAIEHVKVRWELANPNLTPDILMSLADGEIFKSIIEAAKEKFNTKMPSLRWILIGVAAVACVLIGGSMMGLF